MNRKINNTVPLIRRRRTTRYAADITEGLTKEQVAEYRRNGWDNRAVEPPSKTTADIIKSNTLTYFNLIFLLISILLIIVGSFRDLTFLPIILANSCIGIFQELRAKKTLDDLTVLSAPKATVIRSGKRHTIPAEQLVLDDIVLFSAGNQIPADAVVLDGQVQVNESLLTGESDEITKCPGDHLMSGSFIVSGNCYARLEKVGQDSYISKLTIEAKATKEGEQSEMIRSLNKLVKFAGIAIIPIGIILFYQSFFLQGLSLEESVTSMVAAVIGMIPEGLYLLSSVTLAVSFIKLSMKKVLVHDMKCIETLARVNVLCVDKTGTITENKMNVKDVVELPSFPENGLPLETLLSDFAQAMPKDNITMDAMQARFRSPSGERAMAISSFSSAFKYSSATFSSGCYVLGAPEFVLREDYPIYQEELEEQGKKGYRALLFGKYDGRADGKALTGKVTPYAYILIANQIRKDAVKTFRFFTQNHVAIKVISGDNPVTVSQVAKQAGIDGAESYIDASTLKTKEELYRAVQRYTVFGRVTPSQKRAFVRALKHQGNTVAMTGDGVNDVLALKDADCSIAMAAGSDAAAQASQLVLLDNDFAHMPEIVAEGRQVVNNMERSGSLFLVKNIFSLLLSVFSIVFQLTYPLRPSQISLISMFTIGVPGFFLSQLPNRNLIHGKFISNILLKALPAALTDMLIVSALVTFGEAFNISSIDISTACTILVSIVGFMILFHIIEPMDRIKWTIWIGCAISMLFSMLFLHDLFGITGMSLRCVMLFIVFSIVTDPLFRWLTTFIRWLTRVHTWIVEKIHQFKKREKYF